MTNIKAAVLGGFVALLGVLAGEGLAHAECDAQGYSAALAEAHECGTPTSWAEQVSPGVWVAKCGDANGKPALEGSSYSEAMVDVLEGAGRGYSCEVIELQDGSFEAQCDEVSSPVESAACSEWAHGFGVGEDDADGMYEACMVIALHTGAVK